jgi:uncharacterized protein (DUF433 family)
MPHTNRALTASEAASVTGVPLKQVHRIIDAGLLTGRIETHRGSRRIIGSGLVGLKLAYMTADTLTMEARRRIIGRVLADPTPRTVSDQLVTVEVQPIEAEVAQGLDALEKAKSMVSNDKGIMGGTPCVAGTRVPVHDIADMLANGDDPAAILAAYPQLGPEQLELASIYTAAYPRRGRPPGKPARRAVRGTSRTLRLDELPSAS